MQFTSWFGSTKYRSAKKQCSPLLNEHLTASLSQHIADIQTLFTKTPDLNIRRLTIRQTGEAAALVYLNGLVDKSSINNNVLQPLQHETGVANSDFTTLVGQVQSLSVWSHVQAAIFHGKSVLFVDGRTEAYALDTQGWPQRAIVDPQLEASLSGAHQGFVETGMQNIALIRRYIPDRELKIKELTVGQRGQTSASILYLADVANPEVLQVLESRLQNLDVDTVITTGELAEMIEDNPRSLFPQFITTERPDSAASQILQGRFAVVLDRSPSVLIAPVVFMSFFQTVDDYSTRWSIATFIRLLRMFAFFVAILLPAFYISVISYNFEIIPVKLLLSIGEYRGRVPFPPFFEAVLMELTLEMIREAGVRLPAPVGQTVGIVGGIVIGQAIVQAGLISSVMVIVVAFTAIASFILPNYDMVAAIRLTRFGMMIAASMFGLVGILIGMLTMISHLISLESLGTPYTNPFAPARPADWKDTAVRLPLWLMRRRPSGTKAIQSRRKKPSRSDGDPG